MSNDNQDVSTNDIYAMLAGEMLPADVHKRRADKALRRKIGARQREIEAELEKFSTGFLLKQRSYSGHGYWQAGDTFYEGTRHEREREITEDEYVTGVARQHAVYAVLARRPHLPSKPEGHSARHKAATAHHGPKKKGGSAYAQSKQPKVLGTRRAEQARRKLEKEREAFRAKMGWNPWW